jgi:hypothetical protein
MRQIHVICYIWISRIPHKIQGNPPWVRNFEIFRKNHLHKNKYNNSITNNQSSNKVIDSKNRNKNGVVDNYRLTHDKY